MGAKKEDVTTFPTYYSWRNWIRFFAKYTQEDKLEVMSRNVLESVFYEVYAGIHRGEYNRMRTVMMAYDDALCGVAGKAGPNRIFSVDHNEEPFRKLFASGKRFYIEENGFPAFAAWLRELPEQLGIEGISWADAPGPGVKTISLCKSIFQIDDMSLTKIYIDLDNCILRDEDDALDVINFNYSKRSFMASQKPIFLEKLRRRLQLQQ
jgi:hypothetical protein